MKNTSYLYNRTRARVKICRLQVYDMLGTRL